MGKLIKTRVISFTVILTCTLLLIIPFLLDFIPLRSLLFYTFSFIFFSAGVGKTTLILSLVSEEFSPEVSSTCIPVDY